MHHHVVMAFSFLPLCLDMQQAYTLKLDQTALSLGSGATRFPWKLKDSPPREPAESKTSVRRLGEICMDETSTSLPLQISAWF